MYIYARNNLLSTESFILYTTYVHTHAIIVFLY